MGAGKKTGKKNGGGGGGGPNAVAALTHPAENKACFKEKNHIIY